MIFLKAVNIILHVLPSEYAYRDPISIYMPLKMNRPVYSEFSSKTKVGHHPL